MEERDEKKLTYDIPLDCPMPQKGEYIVTVGKRGIGTIMMIKTCRLVVPRVVRDFSRYKITAVSMPELKPYTEYAWIDGELHTWIRGERVWDCVWHPRNQKP